jgi:hypothetical protein
MNRVKIAADAASLAKSVGWRVNETRIASTGSIYVELVRNKEWVVVRVADHKQVYHRWLTTYSVAPGDLWFEELEGILSKPYGEVGDIL